MRRIFTAFLLPTFYLILSVSPARACTCPVYEPPDAFESAEGVFVGKVVETGGLINPYVVFAVEKSYKFIDVDEVTLDVHGCGTMKFFEGETYVVYAFGEKGDLFTGDCTRTAMISRKDDAMRYATPEKDIEFLKDKPSIPVTKTFYTRNVRVGAITAVVVLTLLGIGFLISKLKGGEAC